jgi:hypothetical protein
MSTLPPTLDSPRFTGKRFADAYRNSPTIKAGESGEHVRILQQAFIDLKAALPGATVPHGTPHGKFDDELKGVVLAFQAREFPSEPPDGKVGKKTLYRLHQLLPTAGAPLPPLPAGAAAADNAILLQQLTTVLRDSHAGQVAFWFREFHVTGGGLREVADHLDCGKIGALYDPGMGTGVRGVYQADNQGTNGSNRFVMPKLAATGWKDRSYIVHEGIHALQDVRKIPATTAVSEAAAYIGQAMYYRLAAGKTLADAVTGPGKPIFQAADPIAVKLIARGTVAQSEVDALYAAIQVLYAGVPNPDYDGIPG